MKSLILFCIGLFFSTLTYAQTLNSRISVALGNDQRSVVIKLYHPEFLAADISLLKDNGKPVVEKHFKPAKAQRLTIKSRGLSDGMYTLSASVEGLTVTHKLRIYKDKLYIGSEQTQFITDQQTQ